MKQVLKIILYKPLYNALIFLIWLVPGHNLGIAIIILTIIVRLVLYPSSLKAIKVQKQMRDLQPELNKLKEKYKDDRKAFAQAQMEFYKVHKISPMGSCLPMLIQFPILIILYYVFINGLSTKRFDLLYAFTPRPEIISTIFLGIDLAHPNRWILPIITGAAQFIASWQMMPRTPKPKPGEQADQQDAMQQALSRQMLYFMPVITVIIAMRMPAALPLYWLITTLFSIAQQWWIMKGPTKVKSSEVMVTVRDKGEE